LYKTDPKGGLKFDLNPILLMHVRKSKVIY